MVREFPSGDRLVRRIERTGGILLTIFTGGAWALFSFRAAVGVFLGGLIAGLSFEVLKWQLRKAFEASGRLPSKGGLFASYYLRFIGTLFLVFVVLSLGWADPISFLVGLSTVVFSVFIVGAIEFMSTQAGKGKG